MDVTVSRRGLLLFAAMSLIWGIPYLFIRIAVGELSPVALVFFRTGLAAVILLPFALSAHGLRAAMARWLPLLVFAAVEIALPWFFLASAEQHLSSALAGLLLSAVPLVGVVIATATGNREHLRLATFGGLLLGLGGVVLIVGFDLRASQPIALLEMAGVVVCYALGPAILARFLTGVPSVTVNGLALAICCVAYAPLAALRWPGSVPSVAVLASIVVLAVVCTALAFLLFFALIQEIGPVRALVITYINPAVAAVLGVVVLHESFSPEMAAGFVLVLAGSVLATRRRKVAEPTRSVSEARAGEAV